ncbi:MAG: ribosome maturation factor RimM [Candidatus Binataceae bacterium]
MNLASRLTPALQRHEAPSSLLRVGQITGAHGLRGAVRLRPDNPDSPAVAAARRILLEREGKVREYGLLTCRRINRHVMRLTLDGIEDADAAEALKGATALIAAADLPRLRADEFYYFQVIGAQVQTSDGRRLGRVEEVFSNGANEVWIVREGTFELMIPVIADVVCGLDLERRLITVEAVPGLLE